MSRLLLCASLLVLATLACASFDDGRTPSSHPTPARDAWTGPWHGTLDTGKRRLRLQLIIEESPEGALSGQLESPDQDPGRAIPLTTLSVDGGRLRFALPAKGIHYEGAWEPGTQRFSGTFHQGASFPLAFERGRVAVAPAVQGMDGAWEGMTRRNGADMRMALRVTTGPRGTEAEFDAPDMLSMAMPVTGLVRQGNRVRFTLPTAGVTFTGRIKGQRLSGQWTDGSTSVFKHTNTDASVATLQRPQTPQPPFPYRTIEARIPNASAPDVTLAGTLSLPDGDGPFPAVILITGSGAQDRDESAYGHKPFQVLADHLARRGIAVLRYDDRGVGGSTGTHAGATSADFATDANAAFAWVATRPEIRRNAIGLLGHSEGGMIGPLAALENSNVSYLVLLAAPGVRIAEMLEAQRRALAEAQGRSAAELAASDGLQARLMEIAASMMDDASAKTALNALMNDARHGHADLSPGARDSIERQVLDPWFRWFLRYDPAPALARFRGPILALNGSLDRQVLPKRNLAGIRSAVAANRDATIIELPGLNHLFQTALTGGLGEYAAIEETMAPAALDEVSDWIAERYVRNTTH